MNKIILNVGGIKYETYRSTLTAHSETLLGTMFHPRNQAMLHPTNGNEYFIDRNGYAFHFVMEYYRTGTVVWRPEFESSSDHIPSPQSSSTPCITSSSPPTSSHTEINNATVPTRAAAALVASTSIPPYYTGFSNSSSSNLKPTNTKKQNCKYPHVPYISLPELEKEFEYFQIPFTSRASIAHKAAGELLDSFASAIEELLCASIAKLMDRISITFYRDGSPLECIISSQGSKLREFSINGYCIINHFYEDIKKYLETIFPNVKFKLEFGNNYKSLTISMSHLFTRNTIKIHSKIGKLLD
ncbi:10841_t:CDS:2 [Diversispora eburnea]|uniref:10841_t:CDS:1 n=1 Tax=Diversispora eburnea TaxID=1213867 RepID=A0A9N8ZFA3_9GLOM|nr:10841_t:CDS:2 [Diversispora eburnea]